MPYIAYTRPDGGVSVVIPAPGADPEKVRDAVPPDATDVTDLDTLPSRTYRNAWRLTGGKVAHDMPAARELKMAELREARNAKLAETDGLYLRAQEQDNPAEVARLKGLRQRLRDLPATVNLNMTDVEALAAFVPEDLK